MKTKILVLILLLNCVSLFAQTKFWIGVHTGIEGYNNDYNISENPMYSYIGGSNSIPIGISADALFNNNFIIQLSTQYLASDLFYYIDDYDFEYYKPSYNRIDYQYIGFNLYVGYQLSISKKLKITPNIGFNTNLLISEQHTLRNGWGITSFDESYYQLYKTNLSSHTYAIAGKVSFEYLIKDWFLVGLNPYIAQDLNERESKNMVKPTLTIGGNISLKVRL